jgi:hypothetical protein
MCRFPLSCLVMSRHAFDFSPLFHLFDVPLKPYDVLEAGIYSDTRL